MIDEQEHYGHLLFDLMSIISLASMANMSLAGMANMSMAFFPQPLLGDIGC